MRTRLLFLATTFVSTVAAAPLGCGSLDGHTGTPGTLATVQGGLLDPSGYGVHNDVRVAVVWRNLDNSRPQIEYSVSQDLPVQPVFPSSFVVQLDGPPPAAALTTPQGFDFLVGEGVVVAYEDLNGNGKLDLVADDAGAFVDRIVGANEDLFLIYIGGPIPPTLAQNQQDFIGTPMSGYNIVRAQKVMTCSGTSGIGTGTTGTGGTGPSPGAASSSGADSNSGAGSGSSGGAGSATPAGTDAGAPADPGTTAPEGGGSCTSPPAEWLPMTTPYDLTVSSDPQINQIMCENGGSSAGGGGSSGTGAGGWDVTKLGTPPGGYPSPTDPGLKCQGSTGYVYEQCVTTQQSICAPTVTNCTSVQIDLGSGPPPPGWPCP